MRTTRNALIAPLLLAAFGPQLLQAQPSNPFGEIRKSDKNSTLNMHLCPKGEFAVGRDQWGDIVRVNMLKIRDWSKVPGVKKAWIMKGFEGEEGMAFHPIISEVKDVDGDGELDIFRRRSEHAREGIERLDYDDGSVVWVSEPVGAMSGDESRLPVFDLHGNGRYCVVHATRQDKCFMLWCIDAGTGKTEWRAPFGDGVKRNAGNGQGDVVVGHFLDKQTRAVVVRDGGVLHCFDHTGKKTWTHDTGLRGGAAYAHELYRHDADGDGLDEVFANWQRLMMGLRGDAAVLWEDKTQTRHSDYLVCADVDADGETELIYDHHEGRGPAYVVEAMTGKIRMKIDYSKEGLGNAQNIAVGDFDPARKGLEIAICGKSGNLFLWDATGKKLWNRNVPASLLSKGDWDGDGVEDISCHALGANVDGMFSVWNGQGERLYAISFLPSPSKRTWSNEHNGGSWSHATPGGHEGVRRQIDLDGNGRADFILCMGAWHWGSDSILFLMEGGLKSD
jgi:outer membrane protein assembly factor BamB